MRTHSLEASAVRDLVGSACRAPSIHNSQPWRWIYRGAGRLDLMADHARIGHRTDAVGREVILSCGAAADHLRVAAAAAGWATEVDWLPDPAVGDHLATLTLGGTAPITEHAHALGSAIAARRTDRLAFAAPEPWTPLIQVLQQTIDGSGIRLDVVDDNGRPALAAASRRSEDHRFYDDTYQNELEWWTERSGRDDGIPLDATPSSDEAQRVDVGRDFPIRGGGDRRPQLSQDRSRVLVLSTFDDSVSNTLRCGAALSRILLECTAAGFATCTLTHMIEVHASREAVRTLVGGRGEPQALIRVGRIPVAAPRPRATPRRPVEDVLRIVGAG